MVGHTHEDIDGLFGVLSSKLQDRTAYTPDEMSQLFLEGQRNAWKSEGGTSRTGLGIINGFLQTDTFDSRLTESLSDFQALFEVKLFTTHCLCAQVEFKIICYFLLLGMCVTRCQIWRHIQLMTPKALTHQDCMLCIMIVTHTFCLS